jgi:translation elongation factor EF-G
MDATKPTLSVHCMRITILLLFKQPATSTMEFSHYAPAPNSVAEEVIAKQKGKQKSDD